MTEKKLSTYHAKRDFSKTPEPKGGSKGKGDIFVVQKHDASHLHYDFRIEVDGVLKSWAVPKGISTVINEKRLAIQTEDHPLEYAKFAGRIPAGEYGAGTVEIWDHGTYEVFAETLAKHTIQEALNHGALKFHLHGKKLKGSYALARMHNDNDKKQWLLFKIDRP